MHALGVIVSVMKMSCVILGEINYYYYYYKGDNNNTYVIDTRVCFGGRRNPAIFNELSQAVLSIMWSRCFGDI